MTADRRTVLVTGATGALGPAAVRAFLDAGWALRTFSSTPPAAGTPADGHPYVVADVNDRAALGRSMEGVHAVVHMAALLHVVNPGPELLSEYTRVNVEGTRSVVEEAARAGAERVVLLSSICVYGTQEGMLDERSTPAPTTPYAKTKLRAEEIVLQARESGGGPIGSVLRLAAVYGAAVKGNYARLVRALARGRFVPVGRGLNRRTLVHESDVARAILLAASDERAAGRPFNVTDGAVHTVASIVDSICGALGRRPPRWSIPIGLASSLLHAAELPYRAIGRRPPLGRQTLAKYLEDVSVSGEAFRNEVGFEPSLTLDEGWRETIESMRRVGRL